MPTQLPRVPSLMPSSFATRAIGRDVSITIFTASSRNSGEKLFFGRGNYFTFPDVHPNGWTVRKPRGTSAARKADDHERTARHEHLAASYRAMRDHYQQQQRALAQTMADRQEWEHVTASSRRLAIAADAELRRRHPDQ